MNGAEFPSTPGAMRPKHGGSGGAPAAFTLVELLVVISIMAILAGILLPVLVKARAHATKARMASDLQAIGMALEAYRVDFNDYPPVAYNPAFPEPPNSPYPVDPSSTPVRPNPPSGAQILCQALIGPAPAIEGVSDSQIRPRQDGNDGPGFRSTPANAGPDGNWGTADDVAPQGRVYGPYLDPDKFKIGDPTDPDNPNPNPLTATILDLNNRSILYFPAYPVRRNLNAAPGYVGGIPASLTLLPTGALYEFANSLYYGSYFGAPPGRAGHVRTYALLSYFWRTTELSGTTPDNTNALLRMRTMLGDYGNGSGGAPDGLITGSEQAASTAPYLLWCAGPDAEYGPDFSGGAPTQADVSACDDVTNFR